MIEIPKQKALSQPVVVRSQLAVERKKLRFLTFG
jgi:hypothetical protein